MAAFFPACKKLRRLAVLGLLTALTGCNKTDTPYVERPVEELYNTAFDDLKARNYEKAAKSFDEVERQHPYSTWATRSFLMSAYSFYQARLYEKAIGSLDNFIHLHPGNPSVAYAYYLKAMCYYEQISTVDRDQKMTQLALDALGEVIRRFPGTPYAQDARLKMDLAFNNLAGHDAEVGRFYFKDRAYLAALNRFRKIIEKYQGSNYIPEALHRLTEVYLSLGMLEDAKKTAAILGYNYPGSDWYQDTYKLLQDHSLVASLKTNAKAREPSSN